MKILVAIKRVIDYNVRVRLKADGGGVVTDGVKFSINPFDEIALEEALRIRERGQANEIVSVSIGPPECEQQLRTALAMGSDRAVHVRTGEAIEPLAAARILLGLVERESPSVVLLGKQSIDSDNGQTGQMLAALWQRPQATFASKLELDGDTARVSREVDSGIEVIDVDLPAVVTTDLRLNEPRYVKLPDIIKAKSKPIEACEPSDFGVSVQQAIETIKVEPPAERQKGIQVANAAELVGQLRSRGLL